MKECVQEIINEEIETCIWGILETYLREEHYSINKI